MSAESPGDISIYLPGNSSEMGAVFNVGERQRALRQACRTRLIIFGSYERSDRNNTERAEQARGTYVDPSNFAGRAAAVFNNGANTPISYAATARPCPSIGGYANQLMVTAQSVGANTSGIPDFDFLGRRQPCACKSTQWGFWSAFNGADKQRLSSCSRIRAFCCCGSRAFPQRLASLPATGTATYTGHAIADIANGTGGSHLSRRRHIFGRGRISEPATAPSRSAASTERTTQARPHGSRRQPRSDTRVAADRQYRGLGPPRSPARSSRAAQPTQPRSTARWAVQSTCPEPIISEAGFSLRESLRSQ